jgi:hypothetical protein
MGLFDSTAKQTSTGTTTFNTTKKRTNPDWVTNLAEGFGGEVSDLSKIDPNSLVPGADPLQTKASANAGNLTGTPWNYDAALDLTKGVAGANAPRTEGVRAKNFMADYENPYQQQVLDAALADFDFGAGNTRAQQALDLAGAGAFGGSGAAITQSMTEGELARGRGRTSADIRDRGFQTALQAAQADANRRQSANDLNAQLMAQGQDRTLNAAGQLADIAGAFGGEQRANIGAQTAVGGINRDITAQQANAVPDWLGRREELFSGIPLDLFGGEEGSGTSTENSTKKTKGGSSFMDKAGQAAQIAALFMSDRRLKTDITKLYERPDGLGVYLYRYIWGPARFIGVMAQEVLKVKPAAVVTMPNGFYAVDYAQI